MMPAIRRGARLPPASAWVPQAVPSAPQGSPLGDGAFSRASDAAEEVAFYPSTPRGGPGSPPSTVRLPRVDAGCGTLPMPWPPRSASPPQLDPTTGWRDVPLPALSPAPWPGDTVSDATAPWGDAAFAAPREQEADLGPFADSLFPAFGDEATSACAVSTPWRPVGEAASATTGSSLFELCDEATSAFACAAPTPRRPTDAAASTTEVAPRRRRRRRGVSWRPARRAAEPPSMPFQALQAQFRVPMIEAARRLGITLALLKKEKRAHGLERWPFRKLTSRQTPLDATGPEALCRLLAEHGEVHVATQFGFPIDPRQPRNLQSTYQRKQFRLALCRAGISRDSLQALLARGRGEVPQRAAAGGVRRGQQGK